MSNEQNFVSGTMAGLEDSKPTKAPRRTLRNQPPTPVTPQHAPPLPAVDTSGNDAMMEVAYRDLAIGAVFMRQYKPNHYMCYTKLRETDWEPGYKVLIFKRNEKIALNPSPVPLTETGRERFEERTGTREMGSIVL